MVCWHKRRNCRGEREDVTLPPPRFIDPNLFSQARGGGGGDRKRERERRAKKGYLVPFPPPDPPFPPQIGALILHLILPPHFVTVFFSFSFPRHFLPRLFPPFPPPASQLTKHFGYVISLPRRKISTRPLPIRQPRQTRRDMCILS